MALTAVENLGKVWEFPNGIIAEIFTMNYTAYANILVQKIDLDHWTFKHGAEDKVLAMSVFHGAFNGQLIKSGKATQDLQMR